MNDRKAIIERLRKLIDSSKEGIRIRLTDRAFARIAATGLCLLLASTANAAPFRQVAPKPTCRPTTTVIIVVPRNYPRYNRPVTIYGTGWFPLGL